MDEQLTISTPEQVAFHYEMAGIGTRFVASLLDHLIIGLTLFLMSCALYILLPTLGGNLYYSDSGATVFYLIRALLVLIIFLIFWGYFVIFELVWNGQTPGKRAGKLRVIRRDGQPVHAGEVMIRNLVRIVDFLPGFYGIGLITMFIDKDARRLGDLAAGTIVVREGEQTRLKDVQVSPQLQAQPDYTASSYPTQPYQQPYTPYGQPAYNPYAPTPPPMPRYDPLPGISLRDVTPDDYRLIREMLQRASRGELARPRAEELAQRMAYGVASRMGQNFREWQSRGWDPITFLQSVLTAKEARE